MMRLLLPLLALASALAQTSPVPTPQPLWPGAPPMAQGSEDKDIPTLTAYLPPAASATGSAVIVCPGGGYVNLAMDHEGKQIAEWLTERGIAAFVLKYRLGPKYHHPVELTDVQRAIRTVRAKATGYHIEPNRIGIWGFSAGGHLASTAATHFDAGKADAADPIDRVSSRPDLLILCYPVISMTGPETHKGSRKNLLGDTPDPALADLLSNEKQVTKDTPPTFLFHTVDDPVSSDNSVNFYLALRRAGVPAEMHLYEHGRHGVGLAQKEPILSSWPQRLQDWLQFHGWMKSKS